MLKLKGGLKRKKAAKGGKKKYGLFSKVLLFVVCKLYQLKKNVNSKHCGILQNA
ncbi:MAG: hypothetical protein J6W46_00155 [Spirochaetaceae bacterium]|nr:hypothetical protein [Spirochaetaceae bacterium]